LAALTVDVNQRLEEELKKARDRSYLEQIRALIRKQIRILTDTAPEVATVLSWPCCRGRRRGPSPSSGSSRTAGVIMTRSSGGWSRPDLRRGEFRCPGPDVALQRLHSVLNQSSLWIRPSLPRAKKAQWREAVVDTASRMFSIRGAGI
jgi:TetR/AcrR family transcriptional regulator, regulator of autoinduction and epiphytic fitness